ncbi:MAG: hypothetical protein D8M57_13260 [Candidatus Scalindua sp. AMX11]|nr:MAG: hypothetical protein DWQ00_11830 [Candidatus Scalindua sp.]NOG83756.1 hypothetical protein [Planctomycetota bacterium]RZV82915.1 MAG: hypothetical protein EX341_08985 [Candidatus Scalindua sp. SCAELEC01]TDE64463.1 MAG: hypothetical protein D8M57_13260 [Candidatus Scalindua sp. AMX11]GJQ59792.1 MAG: hypothetical protein SCALA701_25930 [Candidatus Scalindua sp.]
MYTERRNVNNELVEYVRNSDRSTIPISIKQREYRKVLAWLALGNVADPDPNILEIAKREKIEEVKIEGVRRISLHVPGWDSMETVKLLVSIWNLLDTSSLSTAQGSARDIYLFVVDTAIPSINGMGTVEQVRAVDVRNHPGWPF